MVKYRIKFSKTGEAKYVSHLDLVRLFSRVFRRAKLPLAYSEGFNPHPKMSIGLPLSVGVTSAAEYLDVDFTEAIIPTEICSRMNAVMPNGIAVLACEEVTEALAKLSSVSCARYRIMGSFSLTKASLAVFLDLPELIVEKRTKRGAKPTDIRPDIRGISILDDGLLMTLSAGSRANLKPDVVLAAMEQTIPGFIAAAYDVHREAAWCEDGKPILLQESLVS